MTEQQLPEGWQMVKFGDIAKHISKRVEPSETDLEIYVGLEHLDPDNLKIKRHGAPSDVEGQKLLVKKGQVIFGKRRAYQRKVAVADWDCICSAHAMVLEANSAKVIPAFLPFFMQSDVFMNRAVAISEGSLSPTIKWKVLSEQSFAIPIESEQSKLLKLLQSIEEAIVHCDSSIKAIDLAINVIRSKEFMSKKEFIQLQEIADVVMGQSPKGINCFGTFIDGSLPLLNGPTEFGYEFPVPVQYTNQITREAEAGDILFCVRGSTTGRMNRADQKYCIGRGLAAIRAKCPELNEYVFQVLCHLRDSIFEQARGAGSTFPNISGKELKEWHIAPISKERALIVSKILRDFSLARINILYKKECLNVLKKSLINIGV
ncbi:restriction endonuclease subunit S [Enterobacter hormaechei subsp. hoffmannii]|uniref:restriction endonuclease subunit S n=1 Tax=Enterobacter hormaechei TaxID=158836 RepID=UPI001E3E348D|nr:restriction endonuclease subunit S [Enterobacter hormaechei]MCU3021058.1 restriction endonuclease subunit S [Enterobacter hormaechei subsp. hoffmannii]MCU4007899.1 restriction endonuclease subunit S [Enterobacter hormaechei subsp. hoffmannii]